MHEHFKITSVRLCSVLQQSANSIVMKILTISCSELTLNIVMEIDSLFFQFKGERIRYKGYLSRQVVFRYDVSLLKAQTKVWISMKSVDLA